MRPASVAARISPRQLVWIETSPGVLHRQLFDFLGVRVEEVASGEPMPEVFPCDRDLIMDAVK